jgi:5-formyltetrahydrofolate cyclo-ligase
MKDTLDSLNLKGKMIMKDTLDSNNKFLDLDNSFNLNKNLIRKNIISKRNLLDEEFIMLNSKIIAEKFFSILVTICEKNCNFINIMLYMDFKNEVKTDFLIKNLLEKNIFLSKITSNIEDMNIAQNKFFNLYKNTSLSQPVSNIESINITQNKIFNLEKNIRIFAPVTNTKDKTMVATEIFDLENSIQIGAYGIREPKAGSSTISPQELDIVIVPAVAFDKKLNRLGYGGGYYDRFLQKINKNTLVIGICFDFQIIDNLPTKEHDIKMDLIISEKRIISKNL